MHPIQSFLTDKKPNIIPIISNLLLNDEQDVEPVCNHTINVGQTINVDFNIYCFDSFYNRYSKTFTFTIDQSRVISISSPETTDIDTYVRLFSGTSASGSVIDSDDAYYSEAVITRELAAGTYTIEITSSNVSDARELSLMENACSVSSININSNAQGGFTPSCRSQRDHNQPYAQYYSFTLDQTQQMTITSPLSNDYNAELSLYSGSDVSKTTFGQ